MKKQYIKMNIDDNYLSLGNLFRLIKELSQNKISAMQTELFCTLFQIDEINDTTVNNYVTGYRGIGGEYKQRIVYLYKRYNDDKDVFNDICLSIISIMDGVVYRYINDLTQSEVASNMGISQVQVSRKEQKVLKKLRDSLVA